MSQSVHPLIEARRDQMFPVLEAAEIGRLWRFGELKSYAAGERIVATGEIAPGAFVILTGRVDIMQSGGLGHSQLIVTHGPGSFMGELAQLSDRPSLVDAYVKEKVEALVIPPRRLRDLLVEEAELGERISSFPSRRSGRYCAPVTASSHEIVAPIVSALGLRSRAVGQLPARSRTCRRVPAGSAARCRPSAIPPAF
jgi:signal-transduction protein with cAMP-binding, CBS, and nucleotidyltransferase domain